MDLRLYNYGKFLCKRDKMNSRKDCWYALLKAANHFEGFESPKKHVPCLVLRQYEHAFMTHYLYCQVEEDVEELKKKEGREGREGNSSCGGRLAKLFNNLTKTESVNQT